MPKIIELHPDIDILTQTTVERLLDFVYEDLGKTGVPRAAIIGALEIAKHTICKDICVPLDDS